MVSRSVGDTIVVTTGGGAHAVQIGSDGLATTALLVIGPLRNVGSTRTTNCTLPLPPAATVPIAHRTVPAVLIPPPVADTKLVFAGTTSVITTPLAAPVPVLLYASV